MAGDGQPFDGFGRILAEGGDIALANAVARGNTKQELLIISRWRERGFEERDIERVREFAGVSRDAARLIRAIDRHSEINRSSIPINPYLFGDDAEGLRYYASTDFQLSSTGLWYRGDFKLPDIYTPDDIISQIEAQATIMVGSYPVKFATADGSQVTVQDFAVQVLIGRF